MAAARPPIFLHSGWRAASTYVWAKFRALPSTYCYFEPLNEELSIATPLVVDKFVPWAFARHPRLDAPYLEEYRPLLKRGGGVCGYALAFAYENYLADRATPTPDLKSYLAGLADFAHSRAKTAVFGCVRTNLRVDWLRHHVQGVHIVIRRDHRRQFLSYLRQAAKGNAYFIERPWVILGANRDHTAFVPLRQIVDMPAFDGPAIQRNAAYAHYARRIDARALYLAFYFLHLLAVRDNVAQCDLVLDIDRISTDARARRLAEAQIDALTGCPISFADCYIQTYDDQLAWAAAHFAALEAEVDALLG